MNPLTLSPLGLLLATAMSVANVFTDVARKHAVENRDFIPVTFWTRVAVTAVLAIALAGRLACGATVEIRDAGPLFGIAWLHLAPVPAFLIYLGLDVSLITIVLCLYFRALQISPLSMCVPFLSFTPVFLIPTGFVLLGELPSPLKLLGVILIVVGSLAMHRRLFATGWTAPVKAIVREKGSRYMLLVSFIFSITNPLDKKLVGMSDVITQAVCYELGLCVTFLLLGKFRGADFQGAIRSNVKWVSVAGLCDAMSRIFQLASYAYLAVVITVSIKRAGIILAVVAGWLYFHEREIKDKLIATAVMSCGVMILYLPMNAMQAAAISVLTVGGMSAWLYVTRHQAVGAAEVRS